MPHHLYTFDVTMFENTEYDNKEWLQVKRRMKKSKLNTKQAGSAKVCDQITGRAQGVCVNSPVHNLQLVFKAGSSASQLAGLFKVSRLGWL